LFVIDFPLHFDLVRIAQILPRQLGCCFAGLPRITDVNAYQRANCSTSCS
jgi:hypothetical protein